MELTQLKGIGEKSAKALKEKGIFCVEDLACVTPIKYREIGTPHPFKEDELGICVEAKIISDAKLVFTKMVKYVQAEVECVNSNRVFTVRWFNQMYVKNQLKTGEKYLFWGNTKEKSMIVVMFKESSKASDWGEIYPIYKKFGIKRSILISAILEAQKNVKFSSELNANQEKNENLESIITAYKSIHSATTKSEFLEHKSRIDLEEGINFVVNRNARQKIEQKYREPIHVDLDMVKDVEQSLPFDLTESQNQALNEIFNDLASKVSMNRLLQGDTGSGKTIVAFLSALMVSKNGYQVSIMAPTEILAKQHFETWTKFFGQIETAVLMTSSSENRKDIEKRIQYGESRIIIGTHVLSNLTYKNLGLVVIDEQHKFGVKTRAKLSEKSQTKDNLLMSATPIPRSVAQTIYGSLKISEIHERPQENQVETFIVPTKKQDKMWEYVAKKQGKVFVVCPRIEETDDPCVSEITSTTKVARELKNKFINERIIEVNGKKSEEELSKAMLMFQKDDAKFLVATTIIEVGIDIKEANTIIIFGAERFGLASLHQLRGRVGREGQKSECFLLCDSDISETTAKRLDFFRKNNNGFMIAEYDYQSRGEGEILGTQQHGHTKLPITIATMQRAERIVERYNLKSNEKILID